MTKIISLSVVALGIVLLTACDDGIDTVATQNNDTINNTTVRKLTLQMGTQSELFYGNSLHSGLGSLSNTRVIDPSNPTTSMYSNNTMDVRYPVVNTSLTYDGNGSYSDLHTKSISYAADSKPYIVSMAKGNSTEVHNSSANNFTRSSFKYQEIDYLGANQYLVLLDDTNKTKLLTPDMSDNSEALAFDDKTLLTLAYASYGEVANGYIVYDSSKSTLQNCSIDISICTDIEGVSSSPKLLGDIGGTVNSVLYADKKLYLLNKSTNAVSEIGAGKVTPRRTSSIPYTLNGDKIYYMENGNIFQVSLDGSVMQISSDGKADGFKAFTDDMVIYGGDDYMYGVAKDGSLKDSAIEISVTTKTRGQKYPFDLGIGKQYLYTTYNVDVESGKVTYNACKLENGKKDCRKDGYWSAVTAAKSGTLNYSSSYKYTPYAYVRVDTTDNYGGGSIKAIDPMYPLEDGITMGTIKTYNFQTFVNSKYDNDMIDSDGNIILYAKNDLDYRGDAFLMNLTKEDSLVNLTNEDAPDINALTVGRDHCHGRKCSVCHSFAGGKIYTDKEGSSSAKNHTIRFEFEDGSASILAKIRKGSGENFNVPIESLVGKNFKAVVVDENETKVVSSIGYYHKGVEFFNCNYCHGRRGDLKYDAPNVITIED